MIVIAGGDVLSDDGWVTTDVAIEDGVVVNLGNGLACDSHVDATGCLVGPAFVDMHTHLREPGETWKEDIETASRAASAGGFSAIVAMPNTDPPTDRVEVVEAVQARSAEVDLVDVVPSAALTMGRLGRTGTDIEGLYDSGVRLFTDDGDSVADAGLLEELMTRLAELPGAFVAQHAEDSPLTGDGHMHAGQMSRRLGVGGMPAEAESRVVQRDLALVERTGVRYHCQHVSARETVDVVRAAKQTGLDVSVEVTPHHLSFDDTALESLDTNFKMYPPLREQSDRVALLDALRDGTIDVVATDHAPHSHVEKQVPFEDAPRGVIGLETAASAVWSAGVGRDRMFESMSTSPARLLGLEAHGQPVNRGGIANLVVFDPHATWTPSRFHSKSSNSPFVGRSLRGRVVATLRRGKIIHQIGVTQQ